MPTNRNKTSLPIGPRLRALRLAQRLSLRTLARQTDFSPSFLSQVELGQVSPSIASLDRIASSLGVGLGALLSAPDPSPTTVVVQRKGEMGVRSEWSRASARSLLPAGAGDHVGVVLITLEAGGRSGESTRVFGSREVAFCVRGRPALLLDGKRYALAAGDSIVYDTAQPVVWLNEKARPAELLLVTLRRSEGERLQNVARA